MERKKKVLKDSKPDKSHGIPTMFYDIALVALALAILWHWVFWCEFGFWRKVALWVICVFIMLGLSGALGMLGHP